MSRRPRRLVIASNNEHKVTELQQMLARARAPELRALEVVSVGSLTDYGPAPIIEETSNTFVGNALLKANGVAQWLRDANAALDDLVLADDSGLCVDAFDGAPGVYSARFGGPDADDDANNAKLIAELRARGLEGSPAHYVCVLAVRHVGNRPIDFTVPEGPIYLRDDCLCIEGRCFGRVQNARRGTGGFGYDPHFWIDDGAKTFAELSPGEKSQRSHRGSAMHKLIDGLPLLLQ